LPQEVELATRRRQAELAQATWNGNVRLWRKWLTGRNARRAEEAREKIHDIRDPAAAKPLGDLLAAEQYVPAKLLYIEVLGKLDSPAATAALLRCAMEDKSERVRDDCWDQLARGRTDAVVASLIKLLVSKDNRKVNRAAVGLARMKNPSAIVPLIHALVTKHKFKVTTGGGNLNTTFGKTSGGGGGISGMGVGGGRPKIIEREIQNREVLNALVSLTDGANFQYDGQRWKQWYARANTPEHVDLRRDP